MSSPLKWEIPGGKVEKGETDEEALERELREELGIGVVVGKFLCSSCVQVEQREISMFVYQTSIQEGVAKAIEHEQLLWARAETLTSFDWAQADIPLIDLFVDILNNPEQI